MEYVAAKSTFCRQCGRSFSPSAPKSGLKLKDGSAAPEELSLHRKLEPMLSRRRNLGVSCFECKRKHEVSDPPSSANCPGSSAHIDLRDYKIITTFSPSTR